MQKITFIILSVLMSTFTMAQTPTGGSVTAGNYGNGTDVLYAQMSPVDTIGVVSSQQFTDLGNKTAQIADDFIVPAEKRWNLEIVAVIGDYWNGAGPADSFTVQIYSDNSGLPGTLLYEQTGLTASQTGNRFDIPLTMTINLYEGHYWISVFAVMPFSPKGQWGIAWNEAPQKNYPFADQDPDQLFGGVWPASWGQSSNVSIWSGRNNYDICFELDGTEDAAPVPISNWAIIIGIFLISTFIILKYRKRIA